MKILLTNDDGIYSDGIYQLYLQLSEFADVSVVAPLTEQSAVGHAITIYDPLRTEEFYRYGKYFGMAVKGTPADCVKIALSGLLPEKPDLVVSGINHGANVASNVIYSGTVSAATEGAMLGINSVAVSLASKRFNNFETAAKVGAFFAKKLHNEHKGAETPLLLNVNVPALGFEELKGWKYAVQGRTSFLDSFNVREDPKGNKYYWLTGEEYKRDDSEHADDYVVSQGYVSVTPLMFDMTNHDLFDKLKAKEAHGEFV